ncbi:MAG: hypothetical protein AABY22_22910, partial [Nanoarchaeota archaeon]
KKYCFQFGNEYLYNLIKLIKDLKNEKKDEKGKEIIKESRWKTIKKHYDKYRLIYEKNRKRADFVNWWYEKNLLGYTYETTLKNILGKEKKDLLYISDIQNIPTDSFVKMVGTVSKAMQPSKSKNGNKYLKLNISDETGNIDCLIFDTKNKQNIEKCQRENGILPKEDNIVFITGTKKENAIFANLITIEDIKVYTRLKEIEKDFPNTVDKEANKE